MGIGGLFVTIKHGNGVRSGYFHLSGINVSSGEKVKAGQLLGSMGMGYSIENGGHYAHLHYGLYPGSFSTTHNYGYRSGGYSHSRY